MHDGIALPGHRGDLSGRSLASRRQGFEAGFLAENRAKVPSDESARASYEDFHGHSIGVAGRPATRSRMKSSFINNVFMPSTSRRSVFAEV